ncbi:MAG TPA: DUF72 domain-containing protein [Anaerolineae bacterium]|nr:DUF72 domain-containing protein [Anaerolineae bacterium]HOQ97245.1 DUF72 domain-containing protein [Anaerolineae bacterium]HPL28773.1 DUF72 domain-containing protein [Anaerolineae bacterium]
MIYVGTSGYSYDDWVGPFYPPGLPKREWLPFYAREFAATEVNYTYYRLPVARTMAAMAEKTPPGFVFTVKASQELTHGREDPDAAFAAFRAGLVPLAEAGKLGCVLAQFPYSFHATGENRDYLRLFRERMDGLATVIEFRNRAWVQEATFDLLRELGLGYCCVDEPRLPGLIPPLAVATGPIAYVRFHGRNAKKWWQHENAYERYDYTYAEEELREWGPKIRALDAAAEATFVFANNHWQGQAVTTARQLRLLLDA